MWPFSKIKAQQQEIARLQDLLTKQLMGGITIDDLSVKGGELSMSLTGSPLHLFADAFGRQFYGSKATNFLSVDFVHKDSGEKFEVTMQRVNGESMAAQLGRLRTEIADLQTRLDK